MPRIILSPHLISVRERDLSLNLKPSEKRMSFTRLSQPGARARVNPSGRCWVVISWRREFEQPRPRRAISNKRCAQLNDKDEDQQRPDGEALQPIGGAKARNSAHEEPHREETDENAENGSLSPFQRDAADETCGDRRQQKRVKSQRRRATEANRRNGSRQTGQRPGKRKGNHHGADDGNARGSGFRPAPSDREDLAPPYGVAKEEMRDEENSEHQDAER